MGDGFGAVGAVAADADGVHEGVAVVAVLVAELSGAAAGAFVDRDRTPRRTACRGAGLGRFGLVPSPPECWRQASEQVVRARPVGIARSQIRQVFAVT